MRKKTVFTIFLVIAGIPGIAFATAYCGFGGKCVSEWNQIKSSLKDGTITTTGPSRATQTVSSAPKDTNGVILRLFQNEIGSSDGPKLEFKKKVAGGYSSWTAGIINQYDDFVISILGDRRGGFGTPVFKIKNYGSMGVGASYIPPSAALTVGDAARISGAVFRLNKGEDPQCSPSGIALMKRWGSAECFEVLPEKAKGRTGGTGETGGVDEMVGCTTTFGWAPDSPPFCTYMTCIIGLWGGCRMDIQKKCQSPHWNAVLCLEDQ